MFAAICDVLFVVRSLLVVVRCVLVGVWCLPCLSVASCVLFGVCWFVLQAAWWLWIVVRCRLCVV